MDAVQVLSVLSQVVDVSLVEICLGVCGNVFCLKEMIVRNRLSCIDLGDLKPLDGSVQRFDDHARKAVDKQTINSAKPRNVVRELACGEMHFADSRYLVIGSCNFI